MDQRHPLTIVVAATRSNGIGVSTRGLPWRLPAEMAYFVRVTSKAPKGKMNAVVMGRKCWESIPPKFRPLKDRLNVVISSQKAYDLGANAGSTTTILASSLSEGLSSIQDLSKAGSNMTESSTQDDHRVAAPHTPILPIIHRTFIIGGATIYTQALQTLPNLNRILLTRVLEPSFDECDIFLPEFRPHPTESASTDKEGDANTGLVVNKPAERLPWVQADHDDLVQWVGVDVAKGVNEEKGVKYQFQMWMRGAGNS